MKKAIKVILAATLISVGVSCTNPKETVRVLEEQGYTSIQTGGFDVFAHGKDDISTTSFVAISPTGKIVRGAVSFKIGLFRPAYNIRIWKIKDEE